MAKVAKELKGDPAIVTFDVQNAVYGNGKIRRIGGTTNTVIIEPDGRITINPVK